MIEAFRPLIRGDSSSPILQGVVKSVRHLTVTMGVPALIVLQVGQESGAGPRAMFAPERVSDPNLSSLLLANVWLKLRPASEVFESCACTRQCRRVRFLAVRGGDEETGQHGQGKGGRRQLESC